MVFCLYLLCQWDTNTVGWWNGRHTLLSRGRRNWDKSFRLTTPWRFESFPYSKPGHPARGWPFLCTVLQDRNLIWPRSFCLYPPRGDPVICLGSGNRRQSSAHCCNVPCSEGRSVPRDGPGLEGWNNWTGNVLRILPGIDSLLYDQAAIWK